MASFEPHFYGVGAFAAAVEPDGVMSSAVEIAAQMDALISGPDEVRNGMLTSIWPPVEEPVFVPISARTLPGNLAWVGVGSQGVGDTMFAVTDQIAATLRSATGVVDGIPAPERDNAYDREETGRLERENHELLQSLAADPAAMDTLSTHIYLREMKLQYMTDFGC